MKRMHSLLIGVISIMILAASVSVSEAFRQQREAEKAFEDKFCLVFEGERIRPWEQEGTVYFFLPSHFTWENTSLEVLDGELQIDGGVVNSSDFVQYETDRTYDYSFTRKKKSYEGKLTFLQSANIGSIYIETESGSMDQVDRDKKHKEQGQILVKDPKGGISYRGPFLSIKSRGNSTWETEKKSYSLKLPNPVDFFAMGEAGNWVLLSNVLDGNKLQNKLCFEMAEEFGLAYTPKGEWVDLYLNGRYWGNYLLCEKIEVGENRVEITDLEEETKQLNGRLQDLETYDTGIRKGVLASQNPEDISGGYLIEKDSYYDSVSGFVTEDGNLFSLKSPQYATREQIDYVAGYIQQIENRILAKDKDLFQYIDLDSFVRRYLLDETVLNYDFGVTSMYFYKDRNSQMLYAGPVWDYDTCMGTGIFSSSKVLAALDIRDHRGAGSISWYPCLYENETFYQETVTAYRQFVRPYILSMIEPGGKIDQSAERIRSSIQMDKTRWSYREIGIGHYESFDNNVRYMKYFLGRRLRFLDQQWLGEDNRYEEAGTGEIHQVTFAGAERTEVVEVPDGEVMLAAPDHLLKEGEKWYNRQDRRAWNTELPIYEDMVFEAGSGT